MLRTSKLAHNAGIDKDGSVAASGSRRPKMGRPPGPPQKVRSNRVVTYVTNVELAELERIADREGKPLSAVVHQILARSLASHR